MIYLTKRIQRVFIVDFFSPEDRERDSVTLLLCAFLNRIGLKTKCFFPLTAADFNLALTNIQNSDLGEGIILHFVGHGDPKGLGNNSTFYLTWDKISSFLVNINGTCNDGLILNTTIMCSGNGAFSLNNQNPKPFFAAIGSMTTRSQQALDHNYHIYNDSLKRDKVIDSLIRINQILEDNQGEAAYEWQFGKTSS